MTLCFCVVNVSQRNLIVFYILLPLYIRETLEEILFLSARGSKPETGLQQG